MADEKSAFTTREALFYHETIRPGKIEIIASKPMGSQRDLSLAYSPGVAAPVEAIAANPKLRCALYRAVQSRGCHFQRHRHPRSRQSRRAGVEAGDGRQGGAVQALRRCRSIDIELDTEDPDKFIEAVALMEPTFGGINLEDIAAPECFIIEQALRERMNIPVMYDDQHGTAIIAPPPA